MSHVLCIPCDSSPLVTTTHAGFVAATFWARLGNVAILDFHNDTPSQPFECSAAALLTATTCIALDTKLHSPSVFGRPACTTLPLFVLTNVWTGVAAILHMVMEDGFGETERSGYCVRLRSRVLETMHAKGRPARNHLDFIRIGTENSP
ncbi:hypothetical protein C8Q80DRAFT_1272027 [Daedaleopsis nitida]|nr:hypothetical protein C8Q80DRAFT_1272027 [Daedaleopsis nitida]